MLPKPSTAATSQALFSAVCHLSRANTLSTRMMNTKHQQRHGHTQDRQGPEEQINPAQQEDVFVPVRNLDHRQCAAGELGGDAAHQFLVGMVRAGQIERRFAELDFERVEEAEKNPRQRQHEQRGMAGNFIHGKTFGDHVHPDGRQQYHRFIGHHLDQLAFRADEAVRRTGLVGAEHEENGRERQREDHQQQIRSAKEQPAGEDRQQQKEKNVVVLRAADDDILLLQELQHVVERLKNRRTLARLHPRRNPAVPARQQTADHGRRHQINEQPNPGIHKNAI